MLMVGRQGLDPIDPPDVVLVGEALGGLAGVRVALEGELAVALDGVVAAALQLGADGGLAGGADALDEEVGDAHRAC